VSAGAMAQSVVTGTVTDAKNAPVDGAKVMLRVHGVEKTQTTTDAAGRFEFHDVAAGAWEIRAETPELQPVEYELKVKRGEPVHVDIVLPQKQTVQQQITVTATSVAEDPNEEPAPVQVMSGEELKNKGARDLRSALIDATGVQISPGGDSGPASSVPSFWGLQEFDAFLLVVDGIPSGGTFNPALTALSLSDVERVEILRGPAPVTYGATSFVGVLNVVHTAVDSPERSLTLTGGSFASGGGSFSTPLPLWGDWKSRLTLDAQREGFSDDRTSFARGHGLWRVERKWDSEHRFWFNVDYDYLNQEPGSPRVRDGAALSPLTPVDNNYNPAGSFLDDHRFTFLIGGDRAVGNEWHWYTTGSVSYDTQPSFRGFLTQLANVPDNAHGVRENIALTDVYYDTHWTKRVRGWLFVVGADYQHGTGSAQGADFDYTVPLSGAKTFVPSPDTLDFHIGDARDFFGPYAEAEWSPFERLHIDAGMRLNLTHESQRVVDGGAGTSAVDARTDVRPGGNLGVTFTAWERGSDDINLYADYRDTFKPAAIDFGIGETGAGPLILKAETSRSVEGGLKGRFLERRLELEASGFLMNFNNLVVPADIGGVARLTNAGSEQFKGFEAGASYFVRPDLFARATYSFHDATFTDFVQDFGGGPVQLAGKRIEMSAQSLAAFGLNYAPRNGFMGAISVNYTGSRYLDKRNKAPAGGFVTLDLGAGFRHGRWEFRVDGRNLTDRRDPVAESELGDAEYYAMPSRRVDTTLRVRF
jgi:iron complex outermembrane receptor protein